MIIVIDGDNSPGTNVRKLGKLDERDKAIIYYASDNGYFAKTDNRSQIVEGSRCAIEFKCIPAGNCAVDLAVAMDMPRILQREDGGVLVLVSKDKHFKIIQNLLRADYKAWFIAQASDIEEVVLNYKVLEADTLVDFHNWLVHLFGGTKGNETYEKIDRMFASKYAVTCADKKQPHKEQLFRTLLSDIIPLCHDSK